MRLLLDTHAAIWWGESNERLGGEVRATIGDAERVEVSSVSLWEAATLISLGRLKVEVQALHRGWLSSGFGMLDVRARHCARYAMLPRHHRDPFDRMLVAQALDEELTVVTNDRRFSAYGLTVLPCR